MCPRCFNSDLEVILPAVEDSIYRCPECLVVCREVDLAEEVIQVCGKIRESCDLPSKLSYCALPPYSLPR